MSDNSTKQRTVEQAVCHCFLLLQIYVLVRNHDLQNVITRGIYFFLNGGYKAPFGMASE